MDTPAHDLDRHAAARRGARPAIRRRAVVCISLIVAGVSFAVLSLLLQSPSLVWNFSDSVPTGLYRIESGAPVKGDLLAIAPAGKARSTLDAYGALPPGRLLLKHLAGASGDTVCRDHTSITINGAPAAVARLRFHDGRALPAWRGCRTLGDSEIFVLAENPRSFDGRYFGAIDDTQIVGLARPILTFPQTQEAR